MKTWPSAESTGWEEGRALSEVRHLYIFGTPGRVGGAATKIRDMVHLLKDKIPITLVVPSIELLRQASVREFSRRSGVPIRLRKELPHRCEGVACVVCEPDIFTSGWAARIREMGLRLVFSNDMMWEFPGESEAARGGLIDRVLFVSAGQQRNFAAMYQGVSQVIVPNYIHADAFPFKKRRNTVFTIGRLSRPDPAKYPANFPVYYEELGLENARFRVQAWTDELRKVYSWHRFGPEWELLPPDKIPAAQFLHSLDLFVYPLGHRVIESWGRAAVEAMLTGCVPVVPSGHQFHDFIQPEVTGFIFGCFQDCRDIVQGLRCDARLRSRIAESAAAYARAQLCDPQRHLGWWAKALSFDSSSRSS